MRLPILSAFLLSFAGLAIAEPGAEQLAKWLKRFPDADTNQDGVLSIEEALAYRDQMIGKKPRTSGGAPSEFQVDPGWYADAFPDHAVCYRSPEEIKELYGGKITSFPKPENGALRIVGTGHSFMAPGYRTLPDICEADGFTQPLFTHTGGGITGSARYKWEQENGIFQFDRKPEPKLLSSIANAEWDAMMWGPYFNDRPEYYECWIDFCLKYHPEMKFYLSDAWPQLLQLDEIPKTEAAFSAETIARLGQEKNAIYGKVIKALNEKYSDRVFIMPTSDAMVLAAEHWHRGELPGVDGLHKSIGGKERSLWRDTLGHLGPGFERLEGYVFYSTLYGKSPELIEEPINFGRAGKNENAPDFPSSDLDKVFRKIAWQAVIGNPLSGVKDENGDGLGD